MRSLGLSVTPSGDQDRQKTGGESAKPNMEPIAHGQIATASDLSAVVALRHRTLDRMGNYENWERIKRENPFDPHDVDAIERVAALAYDSAGG